MVRRLREYLDGLLPLLAKEAADASGELVTTRGALQIPGAPTPQVYVAGYAGPEDAALIGDEETVWARLDQVRDAGVDEFVSIPFDPSPKGRGRTRNCLRAWESRASSA